MPESPTTMQQEASPSPATGYRVRAYGAPGATSPLAPIEIRRRNPGPHDVQIDVLFCGVCHSDLHYARDEWAGGGTKSAGPWEARREDFRQTGEATPPGLSR